jgi:hypothetical protein
MRAGAAAFLSAFFLLLAGTPAFADGIVTTASGSDIRSMDAGPIILTSDQTRLLRLDRDAANVVVNNPAHASVAIDSPRLLIVTPHAPGATSMIVLDAAGRTILQRAIIVTNARDRGYVRVRRSCGGTDSACARETYSYCPQGEGCHEVTVVPTPPTAAAEPPPPQAAQGQAQTQAAGEAPPQAFIGPDEVCPDGYSRVTAPSGEGDICAPQ